MVNVTKGLALTEDLELGFGLSGQPRGGSKISAFTIPYTTSLSIGIALDDRYTKAESDAKYATLNGSDLVLFKVANGVSGYDAVTYQQYITRAALTGSSSQTFNVADDTDSMHAVNRRRLDADLALKDNVVDVNSKLSLKADITDMAMRALSSDVLELTNGVPYNPTSDYNPATKRYVDNTVASAFTFGASGTFLSSDNKLVTVTNGLITGIV
jgi:hypothetical protein